MLAISIILLYYPLEGHTHHLKNTTIEETSVALCPEPQLWMHPIRNHAAAMAGKQHKRLESLREQSPLPPTSVKQPSSASVFLLYSQEQCDHTLGTLVSFSGLLSQICRNNKKNE